MNIEVFREGMAIVADIEHLKRRLTAFIDQNAEGPANLMVMAAAHELSIAVDKAENREFRRLTKRHPEIVDAVLKSGEVTREQLDRCFPGWDKEEEPESKKEEEEVSFEPVK